MPSEFTREDYEHAARAGGVSVVPYLNAKNEACCFYRTGKFGMCIWDPVSDDGDALRLASKLHMTLRLYMGSAVAQVGVSGQKTAYEEVTDHADPMRAARHAIFRAAIKIGKSMKGTP